MGKIKRNGKAYDSGDAVAKINGVEIDLKSIEYGNEQEHQLNFGLGNNPTSWSMGKINPNASMTAMMHDMTPIEKSTEGGLLKIKPFVITVEFVNEFNEIIVDKIIAKFQKEGRSVTGDMGLEYQYDLFALDVELNVA